MGQGGAGAWVGPVEPPPLEGSLDMHNPDTKSHGLAWSYAGTERAFFAGRCILW